jgi:hypothetical protein
MKLRTQVYEEKKGVEVANTCIKSEGLVLRQSEARLGEEVGECFTHDTSQRT